MQGSAEGLTSPMAASCSPDTLAGSLMRKLLVSTTHWPEATAQDSRRRHSVQAGRDSADSMALPLVEGAQQSSIRTGVCLTRHTVQGVRRHLVMMEMSLQALYRCFFLKQSLVNGQVPMDALYVH